MRIIDAAICVNNIDPKGIGRIRYRPYGSYISEIEKSVKYEEWDENDPFIALPFLPLHINVVPQLQQSIKLLKYDTSKDTQNVEYVAGPFASPHDLLDQTFIQQNRDTTYGGVIVKNINDIRDKKGKLIKSETEGTLVKPTDVGLKGNYGSDIIFSENGVQIRGGLLRDRNNGDKTENMSYPMMSKKISRFSLKKFQKTMKLVTENTLSTSVPVNDINYILEYELDNITNPTVVNFFIYKVKKAYGNVFKTNSFDTNIDITENNIKNNLRLINSSNTDTDPTFTINVNNFKIACSVIRDKLYQFYKNNINLSKYDYYNDSTLNVNIFPFYFRPTKNFRENNTDITSLTTKSILRGKAGHGLIYSYNEVDPKPIEIPSTVNKLVEINNSTEQTFSMLTADKIYLTSTSVNGTDKIKKIDFNSLNKYELTQEDYIKNVDPNTYSFVRGEILLAVLKSFYDALDSHIHQINGKPIVGSDEKRLLLDEIMKTLEDELLNKSIRIN